MKKNIPNSSAAETLIRAWLEKIQVGDTKHNLLSNYYMILVIQKVIVLCMATIAAIYYLYTIHLTNYFSHIIYDPIFRNPSISNLLIHFFLCI